MNRPLRALACSIALAALALLPACGSSAIVGASPWHSLGDPDLSSFAFRDAVHGWGATFASAGLSATSDGGRSWQPCSGHIVDASGAGALPASVAQLPLPVQVVSVGRSVFVAFDTRYPFGGSEVSMPAAARSGILLSADGGTTWRPCLTLAARRDVVLYVAASDQDHVWALCTAGPPAGANTMGFSTFLLHTTDGGRHWLRLKPRDIEAPGLFMPLAFVDATHGWSLWGSGPAPLLRVTADGGQTWSVTAQVTNPSMGFSALDAQHAWDATGTTRNNVGGLFATTDGGGHWTRDPRFAAIPLAAVYFANARDGWVVAAGSTGAANDRGIYATLDGGRHWTRELVPASPSDASWREPSWGFRRAGDSLIVGCQTEMFSRPLPPSAR